MTAGELPAHGEGIRLVLARHGQTPSNVRHVLDTLPPGPELTELGKQQAERLASRFDDEKIVAVRASRAVRARQTAEPLAARHRLRVEVVDGIQEIQVGELEGSGSTAARRRFDDVYASWHHGKLDEPMPGGETGRQALTRFLEAARQSLDGITAGAVVLVSHGAMLRLVADHLSAEVDGTRANAAYLPNTGVIVLESASTGTGWRCLRWDGLPDIGE